MKNVLYILFLLLLTASCSKDDYRNDGGVSDPHVNKTTYDFLKEHGSFDSLVRIIDHAGIKDIINSKVTLFVTSDYGIRDYVAAKKQEKIVEVGDLALFRTLDSTSNCVEQGNTAIMWTMLIT